MLSARLTNERWAAIVQLYQEIHSAHRQEPMTALVTAVAEAGIRNGVWPVSSHFALFIFANEIANQTYSLDRVALCAHYWHEVDKFQLRYYNLQGIPYDEKWCELPEAQATLRHLFRQMREVDLATP